MPTSELGQGVSLRKGLSFSKILLCVMYVSIMLFTPQHSSSVGTTPDEFFEAPRRKGEGGLFAIPEILVVLHPTIFGSLMDVEVIRLERWEHIYGTVGYVAGFVKRDDQDGKLKMCACTKYTNILSSATKSDMDKMRREEVEKMTDFNDLELDKRIESECDNAGTYKGCVDIVSGITPDACMFCNAFIKEDQARVLPLAFSKQTYFDPGVRMLGVDDKSASQDVYVGVYGRYWERIRGVTHKFCQGSVKDAIWGATKCIMETKSKSTEPAGYTVYRADDDTVCMHGKYDDGGTSLDCAPIPQLKRPLLEARSNGEGLKIKFPECKDRDGEDTKYCNLEMNFGEKDEDVGFSIIKPKLSDQYDFKKVQKCPNGAGDGRSCYYEYESDPKGNVTCITGLKYARKKYYVRRNGRYHWISELPKVLTAKTYDSTARRYIQCPDNKSIDLSKVNQDFIDTMTIRGNTYNLPQSNQKGPGGSSCDGALSYVHSNYRLLKYSGTCRMEDRESAQEGYCRTQYTSLDNYEPFFLNEGESYAKGSIVPLNDMLQGLCVSNFPDHEYKYTAAEDSGNSGVSRHILNITKDNTSCDFLKIEMWGGGESGSLAANKGTGKPGTYVMGILKVAGNEGKHLLINVGRGGTIAPSAKGDTQVIGRNTTVSLCSDYGAKSCNIRLVAKGGGASDVQSSGHENLLHYRISEGKGTIAADEVFIPYQGEEDNTEGSIHASKVGCERGNASDIKNVQIVVQSTFRGAGGCADKLKRIVQSGADGAVRLTCEKWSGSPGAVKKWSASLCDAKFMSYLEKLKEYAATSDLSSSAIEFFYSIANEKFCEISSSFPGFSGAIESIHSLISDKDSTKNLKLGGRKNISQWIDSKIAPLVKALDVEGEIFDKYIKDFAKDKSITRDQAKEKFISSFKELVRTKVPTYASVKDIMKHADTIEHLARKHNAKTARIFGALKNEKMAKVASENSELVGFIKELANILSRGSVIVKKGSDFESWVDNYRKRLQKILSEDDEVTSIYVKGEPSIVQKSDPKVVEREINDIANGLRDVIKGEVKSESIAASISKNTDTLKQPANNEKLSAKDIFTRLTNGPFLENAQDKQKFLNAISSIIAIITGDVKIVQTEHEKGKLIEDAMKSLSTVLDENPKVVSAYKKIQGNQAISDGQAKKDLLGVFRKLLDSKFVIDHREILRALQDVKKRAQDAGLESRHIEVFDRLSTEEVVKEAVKSDVVRDFLGDIGYAKEGSCIFNKEEYTKEKLKNYIQKTFSKPEVANFIKNLLKVPPQALEESINEYVEKVIAKKTVFSYDIEKAVQEIMNSSGQDWEILGLGRSILRHSIREIMQKNACFMSAFYAVANAYGAVKEMKENFRFEFLSEAEKEAAKKMLADELVLCLQDDELFVQALLKAGYVYSVYSGCSSPQECLQIFTDGLVKRVDSVPKLPDLKARITERIKTLFQKSWDILGRVPDGANDVLYAMTGQEALRCYSENSTVVYLMEKLIRTQDRSVKNYYCDDTQEKVGTIADRLYSSIKESGTCKDVFTRGSVSKRNRPESEGEFLDLLLPVLKHIEEASFTIAKDCGDAAKLAQYVEDIYSKMRSTNDEVAFIFSLIMRDKDLLQVMSKTGFQELFKRLKERLEVGKDLRTHEIQLHFVKEFIDSLEHMSDNEQARKAIEAYHQHYLKNIEEITKLSFVRSIMSDATSKKATELALNTMRDGYPYASTRLLYHAILHALAP
ncbi:hypothetical protein [Anaplasma bovis]|uniref:hypothetical protein n=1 Tax=Anaplasma bovis TaxID=186733 RepID=UPI002FF256FD